MWPALDATLLKAGYAIFGVNIAGTGCSQGTFSLFSPRWSTDGYDAVEWAAKQSWSDGGIGMDNWSFAGLSQLFTAAARPPHLRAIAPGMVVTDPWRDVGFPGGVRNVLFPTSWSLYIEAQWTYALQTAVAEHDTRCIANIAVHTATAPTNLPVADMLTRPYPQDAPDRMLIDRVASINVPVLSMVDWQDEATGPRGGYYQDLLNPATTYVIGTNGQHDIYVSTRFRALLVQFFDRYVKGIQNGFDRKPHVQIWEDTTSAGAPEPTDAQMESADPGEVITRPTLPVRVQPMNFYLHSGGLLTQDAPSGVQNADSFRYPLVGPAVNADLSSKNKQWTAWKPNGTLAYTTAPLSQTLTFYGSGSLDLWVSSSLPDADLQATITEVRPDGQETYVQRGWLRLSQRALDASRSTALEPYLEYSNTSAKPMPINKPQLVRLEIEQFSHVFRAGSSIRVYIDTPSTTGEWSFVDPLGIGKIQILHDAAHQSSLVLGLLQRGGITSSLPICGAVIGEPCRANPIPVPQ
jgi:putative CocE/NonD family hydrolase